MADFGAADTEAFRKEARTWLEANFPPQLRKEPDTTLEQMEGGLKPSEAGYRRPWTGLPSTPEPLHRASSHHARCAPRHGRSQFRVDGAVNRQPHASNHFRAR